jgi:AcrR family transcriptional regulator
VITSTQHDPSAPDEEAPAGLSEGWLRRRAQVASEIERVALDLCNDRPPADVSVEEIARAAGISPRTFFRYFRTRGDVFAALPLRHTEYLCRNATARPGDESVMQAFIAAAAVGGDEFEDDMLRHWGEAVMPALPIDSWSTSQLEDAYAHVITRRERWRADDPRTRIWAAALTSTSAWAFQQWMERGGSRTKILAEAWQILAQL